MTPRMWGYALFIAGVALLISLWGDITRHANADVSPDSRQVTNITATGSPQADILATKQFMYDVAQAAETDPDLEPIQANLIPIGSGQKENVIFASTLSGNPPDYITVRMNDLDDKVAAGLIRPVDDPDNDLLAYEERVREEQGLPDFESSLLGGDLEFYRYRVNLNDWRIERFREDGSFARETANLLNMHGKLVGFTPMGMAKTLTYNKRIFRECAADGGKYAVLVDDEGEPVPPKTWRELREYARLITEWGVEEFGEDSEERPYGLVVQGQRPRDYMRAINPLAATAGSRGFDFAGETWLEGMPEKRVGRYEYSGPAFLGALKLLLLVKADDSVLPGTLERFYEEPRILLAKGRAAMLMDGWHAALIGCQEVPSERENIASAPMPVPYEPGDEEEKAALGDMLGMEIGLGANYRDMGTGIAAITMGSEHPKAAWEWKYRSARDPLKGKGAILDHYVLPGNKTLAYHVFEDHAPEWKEFREQMQPFQFQAWEVINDTKIWPVNPVHGHVQVENHYAVMHKAFKDLLKLEKEDRPERIDDITEDARKGLEAYTAAVNDDLRTRIDRGLADPDSFTFSEWDPRNPERFFVEQRSPGGNQELNRKVAELRKELPTSYQSGIEMIIPSAAPLVLMVFLMMVGTIAGYVGVVWWTKRRRPDELRATRETARNHWYAYVFVLPAFVFLFVFVLFPAAYQIYLSFFSGTGQTALKYVGGENYSKAFGDAKFWSQVVPTTLGYMFVVALSEVVLGLLLASLLNLPLRWMGFYRTMFFVPMVVSMAVVAVIFYGLLQGDDSTVNAFLEWVGFYGADDQKIRWLTDERFAIYSVIGIAIWHGLPYNTILCLAGLQSIPKDLYEAGKVDGAGAWARFFRITIPQMAPILVIIVFNSLVGAARHFGTVFILTEGEHKTEIVSTYIYKTAFFSDESQVGDIGYASTLSIIYAGLLAVLVFVNVYYIGRRMRRRLKQAEERG